MVQYFAICPADGRIEWFELHEDSIYDVNATKVNYLKVDGSIAYKNEYVRLKKKEYIDVICSICECTMVLIPFDVCELDQRKKVFLMTPTERIKFAERFELLDSLDEDEKDEIS